MTRGTGAAWRGRRVLGVAAVLVALQGLGLVGVAVFYVVEVLRGRALEALSALIVAAMAALVGAGLLLVARGVRAGLRWSRAPALVTQLFLIPLAVNQIQSGLPLLGLPLLGLAVLLVALLLSPPATAALGTGPDT